MKNTQKGLLVPLVLVIAALFIGAGVYVYHENIFPSQAANTNIVSSGNILDIKARIDNSTESPDFFELSVQATPEKIVDIKKVTLTLLCESSKMSIDTSASETGGNSELCTKGNVIELGKNANGTYTFQASGKSSEKGQIGLTMTAYGRDGKTIDDTKTSLSFEHKIYTTTVNSIVDSPKKGAIYYIGDALSINFTPVDTSRNYEEVKGVIYLHNKDAMISARGYCEDCTREIIPEFAKGHYTWQIPSDLKPGEYYLEISNQGQQLDNYTSSQISAINFAFGIDNAFTIAKR